MPIPIFLSGFAIGMFFGIVAVLACRIFATLIAAAQETSPVAVVETKKEHHGRS